MPRNNDYEFITAKINGLKDSYPYLRQKSDSYVFSALCIKSNLYKNPALILNEYDIQDMIVDSQYDGGVDVLLTDPGSEASDLIIAQSKLYQRISSEDVMNAMLKMSIFYNDMIRGQYENVNSNVVSRFISLYSEVGEESKIHFIFYTSAPMGGIRKDRIERKFRDQFVDSSNIDVSFFFGPELVDEIKESESRRPSVEAGRVNIDKAGNILEYNDDEAAIVNVSALSIKQLYGQHNINLLSRNLRYHISGRDIDRAIDDTINNNPDAFWMRNNGITIICDDFDIDGRIVKLRNFSIVNGGQTTYMLYKNRNINSEHDFFLPCKIIRIVGNTEDEKNQFSLDIAKAANSQKPIKHVDLKANSPEQIRFVRAMRDEGIFYQTKRGEIVPRQFRDVYNNTHLGEVGKLCLSGIFQIPCACRNRPSLLYQPKYYDPIFNGNQTQVAKIVKELLYIDYFFNSKYIKKYDRENNGVPFAQDRLSFAHNARTICTAFVALATRYIQGNITEQDIAAISSVRNPDTALNALYESFCGLGSLRFLLPPDLFCQKDECDKVLSELFNIIINYGVMAYSYAKNSDPTLTATNFLKKDKNYYDIIFIQWNMIREQINNLLSGLYS